MLIKHVQLYKFVCVLVFSNIQKLSVRNFKAQNSIEQVHRSSLIESEDGISEYPDTFFYMMAQFQQVATAHFSF